MIKFLFDIRFWVIVTVATMFVGCSDDKFDEQLIEEEETAGPVYIRFRMNLAAATAPGGSRADAVPPSTTPGEGKENAVNSVCLLVYDAATSKLIDVAFLNDAQTTQISSPEGVCVPVFAEMGKQVRIYAAANLPARMRNRLIIGSGLDISVPPVSTENNYQSVINEFVPGSNGLQSKLDGLDKGCIPMTGQFMFGDTGTDVITIDKSHDTKDKPLHAAANISRIVAKIHVLATPVDASGNVVSDGNAESPRYARAINATSSSGESLGWISLDSVRYIPNGINKSTYILPQANNAASGALSQYSDLNMSIEDYMRDGKFDAGLWRNDFVFLNGSELDKENGGARLGNAEAYDAQRLDATKGISSTGAAPYVRGMYCPENYFDRPADEASIKSATDAIPMITTVSITARLVPRVLLIESDYKTAMNQFVADYYANISVFNDKYELKEGDFTLNDAKYWEKIQNNGKFDLTATNTNHGCIEYTATSENEARYIINSSLKMNRMWQREDTYGYQSGDKFSSGTYYVYDRQYDGTKYEGQRYLCLTAGAVKKAGNEYIAIRGRSVPHVRGWGYYYTYLDNDGSTDNTDNGTTPYTASQVTRNTYYIVTVGNFGVPGGTISDPEYIKVNTNKVGWDYAGRGEISLY